MAAAVRGFRRAGTPVEAYRPTTGLVTAGPYRWSRNPMYVSLALLYAGIGLALVSAAVLALLVPFLLVVRYGVVAREERYLEARLGARYRAYAAVVRRWL